MSIEHAYDALAQKWDTLYTTQREQAEDALVVGYLRRKGYLQGNILEVASGTGLLLDYAKDAIRPGVYLGVDVNRVMVAEARRKHPRLRALDRTNSAAK